MGVTVSGVLSMTHMRVISSPWLVPYTPAVEVVGTGTVVIKVGVRQISTILTPILCVLKSDAGYVSDMATSYGGMVYSGSLWGGNGIDMGWLDGMTGCGGECNIDGSSVSFSNFALKHADPPTTTTTTTTTKSTTTTTHTTTSTTTKATTTTTTTTTAGPTANPNCPGGSLAACMALCPDEDPVMFQACVKECIAACS